MFYWVALLKRALHGKRVFFFPCSTWTGNTTFMYSHAGKPARSLCSLSRAQSRERWICWSYTFWGKSCDAERVSSASKAGSLDLDGFQVPLWVLHDPKETLQQSWDWRAPICQNNTRNVQTQGKHFNLLKTDVSIHPSGLCLVPPVSQGEGGVPGSMEIHGSVNSACKCIHGFTRIFSFTSISPLQPEELIQASLQCSVWRHALVWLLYYALNYIFIIFRWMYEYLYISWIHDWWSSQAALHGQASSELPRDEQEKNGNAPL